MVCPWPLPGHGVVSWSEVKDPEQSCEWNAAAIAGLDDVAGELTAPSQIGCFVRADAEHVGGGHQADCHCRLDARDLGGFLRDIERRPTLAVLRVCHLRHR
jgi:hypothetical protein